MQWVVKVVKVVPGEFFEKNDNQRVNVSFSYKTGISGGGGGDGDGGCWVVGGGCWGGMGGVGGCWGGMGGVGVTLPYEKHQYLITPTRILEQWGLLVNSGLNTPITVYNVEC